MTCYVVVIPYHVEVTTNRYKCYYIIVLNNNKFKQNTF